MNYSKIMKATQAIFFVLFVPFVVLLNNLAVAQTQEFSPSPAQQQILKDLEKYLNGFTAFSADFRQDSTKGDTMKGKLYIQRPGKMRFQYNEPSPFQLLANGSHIVFFEPKRDQVTYIPTDKTPAALILRNNVSFKDPALSVLDVMKTAKEISVTLVQKKDPMTGKLTLYFKQSPMTLTGWEIIDASGVMTTITLTNPKYDMKLDRKLFIFDDPRTHKTVGDL